MASHGRMVILQVQVADVEWIRITSQEEISLMVSLSWVTFLLSSSISFKLSLFFQEGSSQTINLMAGINDGNTFDSSQVLTNVIYLFLSLFSEPSILVYLHYSCFFGVCASDSWFSIPFLDYNLILIGNLCCSLLT